MPPGPSANSNASSIATEVEGGGSDDSSNSSGACEDPSCHPLVSPALASNAQLRCVLPDFSSCFLCVKKEFCSWALASQMPPTSLVLAGLDPLLDDGVLFAHRLHENGVAVRMQVRFGFKAL